MPSGAALNAGLYAMRPVGNLEAVTPSDTVDLTAPTRWVYVGGAGDLEVITEGGDTVVISTVAAGTQLPIAVTRIKDTNTTATAITAGW